MNSISLFLPPHSPVTSNEWGKTSRNKTATYGGVSNALPKIGKDADFGYYSQPPAEPVMLLSMSSVSPAVVLRRRSVASESL